MRLSAKSLVLVAALAIAASAAHAATIDFSGASFTFFTPGATYSEAAPFTVTDSSSSTNWYLNPSQGHPPPGIATQAAGTSSTPYQLTISGSEFLFDSVDIGGFTGTVVYSIDGYNGSTLEFSDNNALDSNTGTVAGTPPQAKYTTYNLAGVSGIDNDITSLVITVYNTAGGSNPSYVDNIVVTATPEPSSLLLLGTGLIGLGAIARRRLAL